MFDGVNVEKNSKGVYKCPFNCSDPRFPVKTWKTDKGFQNHMKSCPKCPSAIAKKEQLRVLREAKYEADKRFALASATYKVGDMIWYVHETITNPTHVWNGLRMVKVRYESLKRFEARSVTITSVDYINGSIAYNGHISPGSIKANEGIAKASAEYCKSEYQYYLDNCSNCR